MVHPRTIHGQSIGQNALDFWTFFGRFHGQSIGQSTDGLKNGNKKRASLPGNDREALRLIEMQMRCYAFLLMKSSQSSILYAFSKTSFGDHDT